MYAKRKTVEQALEQCEERFRVLVEGVQDYAEIAPPWLACPNCLGV
jgi:hypothetical protein